MAHHFPYGARMRFLGENISPNSYNTFLDSFADRCVEKGYFDNEKLWGNAKNNPRDVVYLLLRGIYLEESSISLVHGHFPQPLMSPFNKKAGILVFNDNGNLINDFPKKSCLDFKFYSNAINIIKKGNKQLLDKIQKDEPVFVTEWSIDDYKKHYPSHVLKPLKINGVDLINGTSINFFEYMSVGEKDCRFDKDFFKLSCYSYGADVVLNYSRIEDSDHTGISTTCQGYLFEILPSN